jgi:hypothetical protein
LLLYRLTDLGEDRADDVVGVKEEATVFDDRTEERSYEPW